MSTKSVGAGAGGRLASARRVRVATSVGEEVVAGAGLVEGVGLVAGVWPVA
jgi:hypothetical protein